MCEYFGGKGLTLHFICVGGLPKELTAFIDYFVVIWGHGCQDYITLLDVINCLCSKMRQNNR